MRVEVFKKLGPTNTEERKINKLEAIYVAKKGDFEYLFLTPVRVLGSAIMKSGF
jgi:hypothetical protein